MDNSVFYYTYSTIAQTLAAGFAILFTATLRRMERMEDSEGPFWKKQAEIVNLPPGQHRDELMKAGAKTAEVRRNEIDKINKDLPRSARWTMITVVASIVMIPMTNPMHDYIMEGIMWGPTIGIVAATCYTVWTYFDLIVGVTEHNAKF